MNSNKVMNKLWVSAALSLVVVGAAFASENQLKLMVQAKKFDPGNSGEVLQASWLPYIGVDGSHGLSLGMKSQVPYPPGASADATVLSVQGHQLYSLGFDHKIGTACSSGAPRWNVETSYGGVYALSCLNGTHVDLGNGWERITFSDNDVQVLAGPAWPGFWAHPTLSYLQIVHDEAGSTVLDNLSVGINGSTYVFEKPGAISAQ